VNNKNSNIVGALILASGNSERMGYHKPFLQFDDNTLFIEKIINSYLEFGCSKIGITINEKVNDWKAIIQKYKKNENIIFISNLNPEFERFYSIKIGLLEMSNVNFCFLHNTDNPLIPKTIMSSIYSRRKRNAYVVPNYLNKGGHPILLGDDIINYILSIDNLNINLKDALSVCQRIDCNVNDASVLININTPEDYKNYFGKLYD